MPNGPKNLREMLENSAEKYENQVALSEFKNDELISTTFWELYLSALIQSEELIKLGAKKGDNIAISGLNSIDWVVSFFSIIFAGCTAVPIDPKMNKKSVEFILEFTDCTFFIVENDKKSNFDTKYQDISFPLNNSILEKINRLRYPSNKNSKSSIAAETIGITKSTATKWLRAEIEEIKSLYSKETPVIDNNSIAEILFTSGTTGEPKGVMLSHKNLISNVIDIKEFVLYDNNEISFSILPLHHVYELTGGLLNNIYNGNKVHFCSKIDLSTMSSEMKRIQPTIWPVVPLILEKIFKGIKKSLNESLTKRIIFYLLPKFFGNLIKKKLGLTKIKLILCGGAPLSLEIERFLDKVGITITQGYGLSEASPLISVNPPNKIKHGSVGKIIKSCSVVLKNKNSQGHGVIFAKGPNIFHGYYKNNLATEEVLDNGWLDTGDIGYFDKEDYLYITGREKFVIVNQGGENIYPEEIEEHLRASNLIKDSVIFSSDDKNIIAIIQPDESIIQNHNLEEIKKIIYNCVLNSNKQLESYKRINKVYITTKDFEKTSTQKIKRNFLRNLNINDYILAN